MNLPNRITLGRIILSIFVLILMVFPFHDIGINIPEYLVAGKITISLKYIICGVLFIIASVTDFLDGNIARKRGLVTDLGKVMDAIADKILVNGVLIILACDGVIPVIVPVVIITRDTAVDCIKMIAGSKGNVVAASLWGKLKTVFMMTGVSFVFFSDISSPFSFNFLIISPKQYSKYSLDLCSIIKSSLYLTYSFIPNFSFIKWSTLFK